MDLEIIQQKIKYKFKDSLLLKVAMTHRSYLSYRKRRDKDIIKEHNERLEFLGDAVLELVVTEHLFDKYTSNEGQMTSLRSALVNYRLMGKVGNEIGLDEFILLSPGEKAELGKARLSIVADCMEAIIGAIYKDTGWENAKKFIEDFILPELPKIIEEKTFRDAKTVFQELAQKNFKITPTYQIYNTEGKDHDKIFYVNLTLGKYYIEKGEGKSKQDAEKQAAAKAAQKLKPLIEDLRNQTSLPVDYLSILENHFKAKEV